MTTANMMNAWIRAQLGIRNDNGPTEATDGDMPETATTFQKMIAQEKLNRRERIRRVFSGKQNKK
ncbi:MAG: hypothetical protein KJ050_16075 [Candidatus Omnitrophica bacterium]|nr:hypothetical protein [bacterium]MBK7497211.1 hypothetical protein [Candidatus Omnitrophota bacterium]MBV6481566.1 hypothetical protein [bacterium]MCC6733185.1 hypothetical protein [Candidatus Omnitrophota bacterium]MCL4736443.1 hypothetical protein [Candidatus Omnitrophota bacterium]